MNPRTDGQELGEGFLGNRKGSQGRDAQRFHPDRLLSCTIRRARYESPAVTRAGVTTRFQNKTSSCVSSLQSEHQREQDKSIMLSFMTKTEIGFVLPLLEGRQSHLSSLHGGGFHFLKDRLRMMH